MKGWHLIAEDLVLFDPMFPFLAEWLAADAAELLKKHAEFVRRYGA